MEVNMRNIMKKGKKLAAGIISFGVFLILFLGIQRLVMPKYATDLPEGNFTAEYYDETADHDVILIGDCEVYENIDPICLWAEYGITSYIRGNAQQLAWQSYYMLEDTLRFETPRIVIYNVQALVHDRPQKEEYNRMTLDGMQWSPVKWKAIQASLCEEEKFLDYIFPLLRYHNRITGLQKEDVTYFHKRKKVSHNGYYMRIDVLPVSESDVADISWLPGGKKEPAGEDSGEQEDSYDIDDPWGEIEEAHTDEPELQSDTISDEKSRETFGRLPMEYLDRIRRLCEEKGIRLILMKAPSLAPRWYESDNRQVAQYAERYDLPYINFYDLLEETGLDYEKDTYDGGLHMNLSGADKLTKYLGKVLAEDYHMPDHRKDPRYVSIYRQKEKFYQDMIAAQQAELKRFGEVRSY